MMNDEHPADGLAKAFMGLFDGTNVKEALRQAWDRMSSKAPAVDPDAQAAQQRAAQNHANDVKAANKAFLDQATAEAIRAKAAKKVGK